ncbi:MAG: hypothetical protein QXP81_08595 [Nitrososphaerota archaeon]
MRHLALLSMVALVVLVAPALAASPASLPQIYWRTVNDPRPGGELTVAFFLGYLEDGRPKVVPDAVYSAAMGGKEVPVRVEGGIAYVTVGIPMEAIGGGRVALNLTARSEMYGISQTRSVEVTFGPDLPAILALLSLSVPLVLPLVVRRR